MANIGAGETYIGYFVEQNNITRVDTLLSSATPISELVAYQVAREFKYRYLTAREMFSQPLSAWSKGKYENAIYTSEDDIAWKVNSVIITEDLKKHIIMNKLPQSQVGMFMLSKKVPHILEIQ